MALWKRCSATASQNGSAQVCQRSFHYARLTWRLFEDMRVMLGCFQGEPETVRRRTCEECNSSRHSPDAASVLPVARRQTCLVGGRPVHVWSLRWARAIALCTFLEALKRVGGTCLVGLYTGVGRPRSFWRHSPKYQSLRGYEVRCEVAINRCSLKYHFCQQTYGSYDIFLSSSEALLSRSEHARTSR